MIYPVPRRVQLAMKPLVVTEVFIRGTFDWRFGALLEKGDWTTIKDTMPHHSWYPYGSDITEYTALICEGSWRLDIS